MGKQAITWDQLLALEPCGAGVREARAAFPNWPSKPPTWEAVLARGERNGYRRWLISRVLPPARAAEWARLCANSVAHLRANNDNNAAYWAAEHAAYWVDNAAYWAANKAYWAANKAAYWADRAVERAVEYKDEAHFIPSVYSLALTFLEAL